MAASISVRFRTDSRWPAGTAFGSVAGSYQGANATSDASAIPATATSTTNAHSRRAPLATSMTPPHPVHNASCRRLRTASPVRASGSVTCQTVGGSGRLHGSRKSVPPEQMEAPAPAAGTGACVFSLLPDLGSERADVGGLRALLALGHLELDPLVLVQAAVAGGLDGREVGEDVGAAVVRGDEPKALLSVEPLHDAGNHARLLRR